MSAFESGTIKAAAKGTSTLTLVAFTAAALSTSGCYRSQNIVTMEPLDTKVPVSASGQYVDAQGSVVTEDEYRVISSFNFEHSVESPRHKKSQTELELEAEIDRIVAQASGDAVTDFRIEGTGYDSGAHGAAAGWKIMGWSFGLMGASLLVTGAAIGDRDLNAILLPMGGIFAGVGLLSFGAAWTARKPTEWQFSVGGNVVSRGGVAPEGVSEGEAPQGEDRSEGATAEGEEAPKASPSPEAPADDGAIEALPPAK